MIPGTTEGLICRGIVKALLQDRGVMEVGSFGNNAAGEAPAALHALFVVLGMAATALATGAAVAAIGFGRREAGSESRQHQRRNTQHTCNEFLHCYSPFLIFRFSYVGHCGRKSDQKDAVTQV